MKLFRKNKSLNIEEKPMQLYAPIHGQLKLLKDVEDMVFNSGMMGDGVAIDPLDGIVYSPVSGTISVVFPTGHVIGIESYDQMNVILHIGIDTVELNGKGFQPLVKVGDMVHAGDRIMKLDLAFIQKSYRTTTMMVVENSAEFQFKKKETGEVMPGEMIIQAERVSI